MMLRPFLLAPVIVAMLSGIVAKPAAADTLQEVATEGLAFGKSPDISVQSQDVTVTLETVTMHYQIANAGKATVLVDAVLHMPPIDLSDPDTTYALPSDDPLNFLGAQLTIDGQPANLAFRQNAEFERKDVTKRLREANFPLMPGQALKDKLSAVPPEALLKLVADGLLRPNGTGQDGAQNFVPGWIVKTTGVHKLRIEPGQPLAVELKSLTSLGASQDTVLRKALRQGAGLEATVDQYRKDYCIDDVFLGGVDKLAGSASDNAAGLQERRLSLRLTPMVVDPSGGTFHLSIDKGKPDNLISTCLTNLKKTGPTLFEINAPVTAPPRSLRVLVVGKF